MAGKRGEFREIGNLAFYDGWSCDYVYFKSLLHIAQAQEKDNVIKGTWNTQKAAKVASEAVQDAQSHLHLKKTQEENDKYFLEKFNQIVKFLEEAITAEKANEDAYLDQLYADMIKTFSMAERKEIRALYELEQQLRKGKTEDHIEYDTMNTLINVLLQGLDNTKTVLNYEEERINKINSIVMKLLQSRRNQTSALHRNRTPSERYRITLDSMNELYQEFEVEYASSGQLTRRSGKRGKGPYVLWGAAKIETEVPKAIDRVMADWVDKVIDKISHDEKFIKKIEGQLQGNYPKDGNFKWIAAEVQEDMIQAIIQTGISDLSKMLQEEISNELIKDIEKNIDRNGFNLTERLNINGLDESFGLIGKKTELMENATKLNELAQRSAIELFDQVRTLIEIEDKQETEQDRKTKSILIRAMRNNKNNKTHSSAYDRAEEMIKLIKTVEQWEKKYEDAKKDWENEIAKLEKDEELTKNVKLSKKTFIEFTIKNGEIKVTTKSLDKALESRVKGWQSKFGFKNFNPQNLKTTLSTLKARASQNLKQEIITSLKKANFGIDEDALIKHVSQELRNVRVRINGPTLSELMTGLYFRKTGERVMIDWNRYKGKNDSVAITIDHRGIIKQFHKILSGLTEDSAIKAAAQSVEKAQEDVLLEFQKQIDANVKTLTSNNDLQKYSKLKEIMKTDIQKDDETRKDLNTAYAELEEATKKLRHRLKVADIGMSDGDIDKLIRAYLGTLKNAFYVSTTVKSANDYMNNIGFKGGTLGSTLDAQLARIQDIFTSAGMAIDQKDLDWIKSAVLNCFPGSVVGEKNKNLLENYLGSLVAFALFDEGGVEAAIIDQFKENILKAIKGGDAQKIIHLYVVDGVYVKGSTVLQRTLNTIKNEVIPNIQNIPRTMRRGAGVMILNSAQDKKGIVANRPFKDYLETAKDGAWQTTGKAVAKKHVKLQILFLAGLLDIIKSINATLGKVEMPK